MPGDTRYAATTSKALVVWTDGAVTVWVYTVLHGSAPSLRRLVICTDPLPAEDTVRKALADWKAPRYGRELKASALRGLPLARLIALSAQGANPDRRQALPELPAPELRFSDIQALGYTSAARYASEVEQARAAFAYEQAFRRGDTQPMKHVASVTGGDTRARNLITGARRNGLLTSGVPGRPGGELTPRGREIIEALRSVGPNNEEGQHPE